MMAKHQKIEGGTLLGKNFFHRKKSHNAKKTESGDPLVSLDIVCYAENSLNLFLFSSLGQMVQFDTLKFRRTL